MKPKAESTTSVTMTQTISSRESSCLIIKLQPTTCKCSLSCGFCRLMSLPKKLAFVPVASATAGGHRDCPILASVAQWPEL